MMTPETQRALKPKTTMARLVSNHIRTSTTSITLACLWIDSYCEALKLFWGGYGASRRQAGSPEE